MDAPSDDPSRQGVFRDASPRRGVLGALRRAGAGLLRLSRAGALAPVLAWAALIWALSSRPPRAVVDHVTLRAWIGNCAHAVEFGVLALLLALMLPRRAGWAALEVSRAFAVLAAVLAYGVVDELHQAFTPGRNASIPDVVTDLTGAACTLWIAAYVGRRTATEAGLTWRLAAGIAACLAAGFLATLASALLPDASWM